jgi:hypothetical protein
MMPLNPLCLEDQGTTHRVAFVVMVRQAQLEQGSWTGPIDALYRTELPPVTIDVPHEKGISNVSAKKQNLSDNEDMGEHRGKLERRGMYQRRKRIPSINERGHAVGSRGLIQTADLSPRKGAQVRAFVRD